MSLLSDSCHTDGTCNFLLHLPGVLLGHIARFLPPGEAAYNLRLTCKAVSRELRSQELLTIPVGQQRPPVPKEIILARWGETGSCRGLTYKERMQLLVDAARQGDAEALQRLSRSLGCLPNEDVLRAAAAAGHGEACDWLLTQKCAMRDDGAWVLAVAAAAGHTEICDKLYRARLQLHKSYMARLAARAGQSDVLTRLGQRPWGHPIADETAERAGLPGDLQEAWWACAAHAGHLELMLKLKGRGYDPGNLPAVAHGCPLAVLQTMIRECLPMYRAILNSERVAAGIMAGAVSSPTPDWRDKVTWLLTEWRRAPIHTLDRHPARDFAALPDALQRLQWLDGLGFGLRSCQQLLRAAVEAGREELVGTMEVPAAAGYAGDGRRASLPNAADASLITLAVTEGHLGIAKELRAQGVFAHVRDLLGPAGATGRVDVVQWVLGVMREEEEQEQEQGRKAAAKTAQGSTATAEGMGAASNEEQRRGPQQVSGCGGEGQGTGQIESNRVSPGEQLVVRPPSSTITESKMPIVMELTDAACGSGSLQLVQWLRAQGVPWGPGQLGMAAKSGNELLVEWMVGQGYDVEQHDLSLDKSPYLMAGEQGDMAMLRCLRRLGCPVYKRVAVFTHAAKDRCHAEVVRWMHDSGLLVACNSGSPSKEEEEDE